jgi:DNA-binding MarR family transcriptional regulator
MLKPMTMVAFRQVTRSPYGDVARLDAVLTLLERRELSATELRFLVAVFQGHATGHQVARILARTGDEVRRMGRRLQLAGLVRRSHDEQDTTFAITPLGIATLKPLVTAAHGGDR